MRVAKSCGRALVGSLRAVMSGGRGERICRTERHGRNNKVSAWLREGEKSQKQLQYQIRRAESKGPLVIEAIMMAAQAQREATL